MEPPQKPEDSECCGSGCDPCIFDIYEQKLKQFTQKQNYVPNSNTNCITPTSYSIFELIKIEFNSKDTNLYTFKYKRRNFGPELEKSSLLLSPGQHLLLRGKNTNYFTRAYTPIYINTVEKLFTVLIKLYDEGKMSAYLKQLELNSETYWRGPYGHFEINYSFENCFMIGQGSGIAPLFSVIKQMVENENCETFLKLFYCCRDAIYLHDKIYQFSAFWNFTYEIFLSSGAVQAKYNETINLCRLDFSHIKNYLENKRNVQILICGSRKFNQIMLDLVQKCGVEEKNIYLF